MSDRKILVVDDESRIRKLIKDYLRRSGYEVLEASDGEEALSVFYKTKDISLIILDVMMPRISGWEVLKEIRESSKVPIIMLTAKGEEEDELNGYSLGADEYISKPFSPKILVARVEAVLRRSAGEETMVIERDGIRIDENAHEVTVDGKSVELSVREYDLLKYFLNNPGVALSREKILNSVWNYDYYGDARTIDTHVKKLRSKLFDKGDLIKTIWGVGYKFGSVQ
ncbi:MAG: response regulator transcription factor [Lachnospiraceae bacterium]|nr:response regulator transcription factor [Lachnospiraceae bacterium]